MPQVRRIRATLIQMARNMRGTISLLALNNETELGLNLDSSHERSRLLELLGEVTTIEHAAGRPLLSSLVRVKGTQGQGDSFFRLCERLGLGEWRVLKADEHFLEAQQQQCRDFWRDDANFQQYRHLASPEPADSEE